VIGSFMDESFDMGRSGVFAVGGLLGRGVAFFELERRWEKLRNRPAPPGLLSRDHVTIEVVRPLCSRSHDHWMLP